jgi:anti-anti-sigma factor
MPSSFEELAPLDIEVHPDRRTVRVVPIGELDLSNVGQVDDQMRELVASGFHDLVLDLRRLVFIDSSALRMILAFLDDARDDGTNFAVIQGPPLVEHVFEITGILDRVPFREALGSESDQPAA